MSLLTEVSAISTNLYFNKQDADLIIIDKGIEDSLKISSYNGTGPLSSVNNHFLIFNTLNEAVESVKPLKAYNIDSIGTESLLIGNNSLKVQIGATGTVTNFISNITGNLGTFDNININNGNISMINGSTSITTNSNQLILSQTGDINGSSRFILQNRTGTNGAMVENTSLDFIDFIFNPSSNIKQNIRYEHRSNQLLASNNTNGEFEIGITNNPSFISGPNTTFVRTGRFGVGTSNPSGPLHVIGNTFLSNGNKDITLDPSLITTSHVYKLPPIQGITGSILTNNGSGILTWLPYLQYAIIKDIKTNGSNGGTMQMSDIGIWNTRTLNNINTNIPNSISLLNNQIILQPGSYLIQATAPACQVDAHQIRLQCINNVSIGTIVYGTNAFSPQNRKSEMLVSQTESKLDTTLVVTQPMTLEIQHMGKIITIGNPNPGLVGMGYANGFSTNEIYTVVNIMKII